MRISSFWKVHGSQLFGLTGGCDRLGKDTLAPGLEQAVMRKLTGDPHDRDSETYRRLIAPHIYDALLRTALTVAAKHPVVLDAPFLEVIRQAARACVPLSVQMLARSGISSVPPLSTVWLGCPAEQIRSRMIARGAERDNPKLADWPPESASPLTLPARNRKAGHPRGPRSGKRKSGRRARRNSA
ncbi:AAA family ATPase [Nocardia sp. NPDC052112]|uniref:AAA family ATPase n=1 Tax=Nocardia sp. NPDC052112 TaxID=3155646 RepID=UPI0034197B8B